MLARAGHPVKVSWLCKHGGMVVARYHRRRRRTWARPSLLLPVAALAAVAVWWFYLRGSSPIDRVGEAWTEGSGRDSPVDLSKPRWTSWSFGALSPRALAR